MSFVQRFSECTCALVPGQRVHPSVFELRVNKRLRKSLLNYLSLDLSQTREGNPTVGKTIIGFTLFSSYRTEYRGTTLKMMVVP